jgi:glycosyltransferase involved in cell wall biosynthesis
MTISKTKTVLQLCHSYGAPFADVARQWACLFENSDFEVVTVFVTGQKDQEVAELVGGKVIFLGNTSKDIRGLKRKQIRQVADLHQQYKFSFAIAHRFKPIFIATHIPDLKVVGVHHAFGDYQRFTRRWHANSKRNQLGLLAVSNAVRDDIRGKLGKFPEERIETLYNRVDYQALRQGLKNREEARNSLGLSEGAYVFANVGRLHPDKDQKTLIEAFAQVAKDLPEAELVIIGTGRLEGSLKAQAEATGLGERIKLLGRVPDAWRYYRAFDSFLLSSDHEPFGMVLLEAMAAGLPLACTACGGGQEVVGDTGWIFPLGDSECLAKQMKEIAAQTPDALAVTQQAMDEHVEALFTDQAVKDQFWQLPLIRDWAAL